MDEKRCPICEGTGFVQRRMYEKPGETCSWGSYINDNSFVKCHHCGGTGIIKHKTVDEKAWAIIMAIISKGNDAVVRKKGDGYIVLEDKRTIQYQTKETRPG